MDQPNSLPVCIRPAKLEEAPRLTEIALRAKAYWGYSDEFMAAARSDMTITLSQVESQHVFVLEQGEEVVGFYKLREVTPVHVELTDLFIEPAVIRQGWGRALWTHAVATAREHGYSEMTWESDPNAEGFYLHMGAQRIGQVESTVKPGRLLPKMRYWLQSGERTP